MISGHDLIYKSQVPAIGSRVFIERIINSLWPNCIIEEDEMKENYPDCFFYKDAAAKAIWDKMGCVEGVKNKMIYFLAYNDEITLVLSTLTDPDMQKFIVAVNSLEMLGKPVFTDIGE